MAPPQLIVPRREVSLSRPTREKKWNVNITTMADDIGERSDTELANLRSLRFTHYALLQYVIFTLFCVIYTVRHVSCRTDSVSSDTQLDSCLVDLQHKFFSDSHDN